jgi:hypothetical protein
LSFFNKKEDVIHIELTPLGKHYLSIGKLKPHSYKFFDDEVLYDSQAAGFTEDQNKTDSRVLDETARLKTNGNNVGVESDSNTILSQQGPTTEHNPTRVLFNKKISDKYMNEIGTAKNDTDTAPGLKVSLFHGEIASATKIDSDSYNHHIPQINIDVEYELTQMNSHELLDVPESTDYKSKFKSVENNGKRIQVIPQIPLIRILSEGAFDNKENFEIECYTVKQNVNGNNAIKKLKFLNKTKYIENDLLLDEPIMDDRLSEELDKNYSDYYFDIVTDKNIPNEDYCNSVGDLKVKNIYLDEPIECEDLQQGISFNVYSTNLNPDDIKGCE